MLPVAAGFGERALMQADVPICTGCRYMAIAKTNDPFITVTPAKAGAQSRGIESRVSWDWIPAFAGMTP